MLNNSNHVMQQNILLNEEFERQARKALFELHQSFVIKVEILKRAYKQKDIQYEQLVAGRNSLLQELMNIMSVHPGDDPHLILLKLVDYARHYSQDAELFSARSYVERMETCLPNS
jgi:hypothetical protein